MRESCHREAGKSSRELFENVCVNVVFFLISFFFGGGPFLDFGWAFGPLFLEEHIPD